MDCRLYLASVADAGDREVRVEAARFLWKAHRFQSILNIGVKCVQRFVRPHADPEDSRFLRRWEKARAFDDKIKCVMLGRDLCKCGSDLGDLLNCGIAKELQRQV